jgi:imidazolonepropionase-like amidohydrolase
MVEYGMSPLAVLQAATSINAESFGIGNELGNIKPGYLADLIAVDGNPINQIKQVRQVKFVMKNGLIMQ